MYNFFVKDENFWDDKAIIEGEDYNHLVNVLRMSVNQELQICNKQTGKSFQAIIETIEKEKVICKILSENDNLEPTTKITLYQGVPKSDKFEFIIQKSTELGVSRIVPVEMKFCVAKINNIDKKMLRWNKIVEAAAKQSKRNVIPNISNPINVKGLCEELQEYDLVLLAYEGEKENSIKACLSNNKEAKSIAIIVGPEGGLDYIEVEKLVENGAKCVSLGKRILRTETAPITILSMILYEFEL